jgi:hypothetical protein
MDGWIPLPPSPVRAEQLAPLAGGLAFDGAYFGRPRFILTAQTERKESGPWTNKTR